MQPPRVRTTWLPVLGIALLAIAGCGGSSKTTAVHGPSTTSTTTTTNAAGTAPVKPGTSQAPFISRADAVCGRVNAEISAVKVKAGSAAEVRRVVPHTIELEREGVSALEKLEPPASLASAWQRMLGYRRTLAGQLAELLEIAMKNDGTSTKPLATSKKLAHANLAKTAAASGFKDCAKVGAVG